MSQYFPMSMHRVTNYAWINNPFKPQNRPVHFNLMEYKKFTDVVSDSTLQIPFKNNPSEFWHTNKGEYPQLSENAIQDFPFPVIHVYDAKFSLHTSAKTIYRNRLNTEEGMDIILLFGQKLKYKNINNVLLLT